MSRSLLFAFISVTGLASAQIDTGRAKTYFTEVRAACQHDGGDLWHISLCGPMLFADPKTRDVAANQADAQNLLTARDGIFVGKLPTSENIANTAVDWAGVHWTEVDWLDIPPDDPETRIMLLMHESFHRIQKQLGIEFASPSNAHLDRMEGRIFLQLEWRALQRALETEGQQRNRAIADAVIFRAERRHRFANATSEENALERNEGLAEYTGTKFAMRPVHAAIQALRAAHGRATFVRSFAYVSGPAYGLLLDQANPHWRQELTPDSDFGRMLAKSLSISIPEDVAAAAEASARNYDGDTLKAAELARETARKKRIADYRARLVDGPILNMPLVKMNVQFDPNNLLPLEGLGTVYPNLRISDVWGILTVTNGALIDSKWSSVSVPAAQDGWTLDLKAGWTKSPGARKGDWTVQKDGSSSVH